MNVLLIILFIVVAIIALLLLIALIIKKEFRLERQVTIQKSKSEVFNYLKMIRNQEQYSVWVMKDPQVKIVYSGVDGTVGAKSAWESKDKNVGIGEQEIIKLKEGEFLETEIRFKKPFEGTNWATTTVTDEGNGLTRVNNVFYGKSKFPMNLMNLFMDKMVGKDMQQNLTNLKQRLEE